VTVRPETKCLPNTDTFWLPTVAIGLAGEIDVITGVCGGGWTVKLKVFDWSAAWVVDSYPVAPELR